MFSYRSKIYPMRMKHLLKVLAISDLNQLESQNGKLSVDKYK